MSHREDETSGFDEPATDEPRAMCCDESEILPCDREAQAESGMCWPHESLHAQRLLDAIPEDVPDTHPLVVAARARCQRADAKAFGVTWTAPRPIRSVTKPATKRRAAP